MSRIHLARHGTPFATALFLTAIGCVGSIEDPGAGPNGASAAPTEPGASVCANSRPSAGPSPLRRLTRAEYDNTVRDLLGITTRPAQQFPRDEVTGGFDANSVAPVDKQQTEDYLAATETVVQAALARGADALLGCSASSRACVEAFVDRFGKRAFRRVVEPEVKKTLLDLYDTSAPMLGGAAAIELVLHAVLLSPHFLYHLETSAPVSGVAATNLSPYELASRLSYFVWQSMPDDALFAAADSGALADPAVLAAQVIRMLAHERARDALASFHGQWLGLDGAETLEAQHKDSKDWSPALATAMRRETSTFVSHVIREGDGRLETLLGGAFTFVDPLVARVYGLPAPPPGKTVRVELDPARRAGLLSQPSFLASHAHAAETSWVLRGQFVREHLLCELLPPPPPDVDGNQPNDPNRLTNAKCMGCHQLMDPIGVGFDNYDALGRWRDRDSASRPITGEGEITGTGELAGKFRGARELSTRLASSYQARACVATHWYRYAVRRDETADDRCSIDGAMRRFVDTGQNIRELIVAIALSDGFRHRQGGAQ